MRNPFFGSARRCNVRRITAIFVILTLSASAAAARSGAWFDEIVFFEEAASKKVLSMMMTGEVDFFAGPFGVDLYPEIQSAELPHVLCPGDYVEILLNPVGPRFDDGRFNPFSIRAVRVAINNLIDRSRIVDEVRGGLAVSRATLAHPDGPVYAEIAETARAIEARAAFDEEGAIAAIGAAMEDAGAVMSRSGRWTYDGEEVVLVGLIRVEDERLALGDSFAEQLERAGFVVEREYMKSLEASRVWIDSDPHDGGWSFYTGGWIENAIDRDQSADYAFHYTDEVWSVPLTQVYAEADVLDPDCRERILALRSGDHATRAERAEALSACETCAYEAGLHIWLYSETEAWAWANEIEVAVDRVGGVFGGGLWPHTMSLIDADGQSIEGGTIRVALPGFLDDPWNPIAGSDRPPDRIVIQGTEDLPFVLDPATGLARPMWAESARVTVQSGRPVFVTESWCELEFEETIVVPDAAWCGWNARRKAFLTGADCSEAERTCNVCLEIAYPDDLFDRFWHDGSTFSVADCILALILRFDPADRFSAIYDKGQIVKLSAFAETFRGFEIVSERPLVTRAYLDLDTVPPDAETIAHAHAGMAWPVYEGGPAPWHTVAVGILANEAEELAFSAEKADALGIDQMSYVGGASLSRLADRLQEAWANAFVPYGETLGAYLTGGDAVARYEALTGFLESYGHLWVGLGPIRITHVDTLARIVIGERFPDYPYEVTRWLDAR